MSSSDDEVGPRVPISKKREQVELSSDDDVCPRVPKTASTLGVPKTTAPTLPCAPLYEFSFGEEDVVSQIHGSSVNDFVITVSGSVVKFWKRELGKLEFVKSFYLGSNVLDSCLFRTGSDLVVLTKDKYLRVFDVANFNMYAMAPLGDIVAVDEHSLVAFLEDPNAVAISCGEKFSLIKITSFIENSKKYKPMVVDNVHNARVVSMVYSEDVHGVVSGDSEGFLEIWSFGGKLKTNFSSKFDTDLFELNKTNDKPVSITASPDGSMFAVMTVNGFVKLFRTKDGKLVKSIDESLDSFSVAQNDPLQSVIHLEPNDFGNRVNREMKLVESNTFTNRKLIQFDESGKFLVYSTPVGIKSINVTQNKLVTILGKLESTERFLDILIMQGPPKMKKFETTGDANLADGASEMDPWIVATAAGSHNFFVFTNRLPKQTRHAVTRDRPIGRDVASTVKSAKLTLPHNATIYTTLGDIELELFPDDCPKTVENFYRLAQKGFYDGLVFHRVIKGFMAQTGCPAGDGSSGKSIWGGEFPDEISDKRSFREPYLLASANRGPNTNGSQFFITTGPCRWLDGKHSIFGKVSGGIDVLRGIEQSEVDEKDKPIVDIRILQIKTRV